MPVFSRHNAPDDLPAVDSDIRDAQEEKLEEVMSLVTECRE
jgi:hypothetical protein